MLREILFSCAVIAVISLLFAITGIAAEATATDHYNANIRPDADDLKQLDTDCLVSLGNTQTHPPPPGRYNFVDNSDSLNPRVDGLAGGEALTVIERLDGSIEVAFDREFPLETVQSAPLVLLSVITGSAALPTDEVWYGVLVNNMSYRISLQVPLQSVTTAGANNELLVQLGLQELGPEGSDKIMVSATQYGTPVSITFNAVMTLGVMSVQVWTDISLAAQPLTLQIQSAFAKS